MCLAPPAWPQNNANMYISGLDGPALDDMVNYEELPVGLVSQGWWVVPACIGASNAHEAVTLPLQLPCWCYPRSVRGHHLSP